MCHDTLLELFMFLYERALIIILKKIVSNWNLMEYVLWSVGRSLVRGLYLLTTWFVIRVALSSSIIGWSTGESLTIWIFLLTVWFFSLLNVKFYRNLILMIDTKICLTWQQFLWQLLYLSSLSSSSIPTLSLLLYFIPSDLRGTLDLM